MTESVSTVVSTPLQMTYKLRTIPKTFSRAYWTFFCAALCMDLGFGLFFFLFNLYLADLRFDERFIGRAMACLTIGNVVGTIPAIILARKRGLQSLLMMTFIFAPLLCALRVVVLNVPAQYALAFGAGVALCGWPICFSPAIAKLTDENNRTVGFSLAFATGIGLGTVAGLLGGFTPELLQHTFSQVSLVGGIRVVLLSSCFVTFLGILPMARLKMEHQPSSAGRQARIFHPFLWKFLPGFVLWNVVTGSFPMFGGVYLQNRLGIPLSRLGTVFSASELLQFCAVLLAPLLLRRISINKGVAAAQFVTAACLVLIAFFKSSTVGIGFYLLYFAAQFMCEPGIYKMLMESVPDEERSTVSAIQNISGSICQACTVAITGASIVKFGYGSVLLANSAVALCAALFFLFLKLTPHVGSAFNVDKSLNSRLVPSQFEPCADAAFNSHAH